MDRSERGDLITRYREGPAQLRAALSDISEEELDRSAADGWTPRQIAHHTADSELTSAVRLRRLLAETAPEIQGYDQDLFARVLHYDRRPIEPSLVAIEGARGSSATLLDHLSEADWKRSGTHSESGAYSVEDWLRIYAAHCHDHADQVRRARGQGS